VILSSEDLKEGMILSEDLLLPNGAILLNAGSVLTQDHIAIIQKRGLESVYVEGEPPEEEQNTVGVEDVDDLLSLIDEDVAVPLEQASEGPASEEPVSTQLLPRITVHISEDQMSASLIIEPLSGSENNLCVDNLRKALEDHGVVAGINEELLDETVVQWNRFKRRYDVANIAVGKMARAGTEGELIFQVPVLDNADDVTAAKMVHFHWEIEPLLGQVEIVAKNTVIAVKGEGALPEEGHTVTGKAVSSQAVLPLSFHLDNTVALSADGNSVLAGFSGIPYQLQNGIIGVVPLSLDGAFEITLFSNAMKAQLHYHPPVHTGKWPPKSKIYELIEKKNITFGVSEEKIDEIYAALLEGTCDDEPLFIAQGQEPVNGEDGRVEFLFDTTTSFTPKENADGSVDYKDIELVNRVDKGERVARLIPPGKGIPGKDVKGNVLPAVDGAPALLPLGINTKASETEENTLISLVDGNVRLVNGTVEVHEGLVIQGNVDYSTGNIEYKKSVTVLGDIQSGFNLSCGEDLQVDGTIEDSLVKVDGNLLSKGGFVGTGKGHIEALGDVNLGFIKNQCIHCRGTVAVAREALNASIYARHKIVVHGVPLSIAGGHYVAREEIEADTVGNLSGVKSFLEVGLDYILQGELEKTDNLLKEISANIKKIADTYKKLDHVYKLKKSLPPKQLQLYQKIKETLGRYQQRISVLEERKEIIKKKMHPPEHAVIRVFRSVMPGTVIKIGPRMLSVREEIKGPKTFSLVNFEIKAT